MLMRLWAQAKEVLLPLTIPVSDYRTIEKSKTFWLSVAVTLMLDYDIYFEVIPT
ncbi:unnamed protein product [Penicillium camemberti]|uniref:Str. FM013 n=1 Tax=Penicillium camemberti (strain FM 013) TaxID=1429867 RepID=A0A0G4NZX2_PENC3|nr:unnamed protein product [Penicillium camemberti]